MSFKYFLLLAFFATTQAGVLDEEFAKTFSDGDKKDAIVEYPSVVKTVLQHSSLQGVSGGERHSKIVSLLRSHTNSMQLPALNHLKTLGVPDDKVQTFWIANKIAVKGVDKKTLRALSTIPGPFKIREAKTVSTLPIQRDESSDSYSHLAKRQTEEYQWNIEDIKAPAAWNITKGDGIILGHIDTGVRGTHEALRDNYRGDCWLDAVNKNNEAPYDDNGHGTHTMGTAVGTTRGIGVAPKAKWCACKGLNNEGSGTEGQLSECAQFMACPNNATDCEGHPNIVSNSWGGGCDQDFFNDEIETWNAMGIVPAFAIGNSGPSCGSAGSPGDQQNLISVGSTDRDGTISDFSSRGPAGPCILGLFRIPVYSTDDKIKPECTAPGRDILSAGHNNDTDYQTMSGTSMATPAAAGTGALVLAAAKNPNLGMEEVKKIIQDTATPGQSPPYKSCPYVSPPEQPNNFYGRGRINAEEAVKSAQNNNNSK